MKSKRKRSVYIAVIVTCFCGIILFLKSNNESIVAYKEVSSSEIMDDINKKENVIRKDFDGYKLSPLVTIVKQQPEFQINISGFNDESKLSLVNPVTGEKFDLQKENEGKFSLKVKLEKDINYGIIKENRVQALIRVVDDIDDQKQKELYDEIIGGLQCAL